MRNLIKRRISGWKVDPFLRCSNFHGALVVGFALCLPGPPGAMEAVEAVEGGPLEDVALGDWQRSPL